LEAVADSVEAPEAAVQQLRVELQQQAEASGQRLDQPGRADTGRGAVLRGGVLDVQAEELARLRTAGEISAATFRELQRQLDMEHARLSE